MQFLSSSEQLTRISQCLLIASYVLTYSVSLELIKVPLVSLSLKLCLESAHVTLNLVPGHLTRRHAIYDHRTLT